MSEQVGDKKNNSQLIQEPLLMVEEIWKYLPHRYPFLLVDRVLEIGDDTIVAQKNVTINEPFFNGHFPDKPVFPGVLMIEAMAQACAIYGFYSRNQMIDNHIILFVGTDKTRFRRQVIPGDVMKLYARLVSLKRNFWNFEARIEVDGQVTCESNILCTYQKLDK